MPLLRALLRPAIEAHSLDIVQVTWSIMVLVVVVVGYQVEVYSTARFHSSSQSKDASRNVWAKMVKLGERVVREWGKTVTTITICVDDEQLQLQV